ncbi:hypothetical protein NZK35_06990 [Stieleria sp. ICT_E10.1]|uniref:hypothetical protein n=1 Tax=Stieleria sedimenti TaxID=2976331 RepID=UPI00217F364D|nr:hypothetical protein [Stieleria sedimenti]MCS7466419.1 hypothetical protein [Stieleria sedimenti]
MIPNPIHKVLSTLSSHEVKHLLMGGQACVFYGAAEFSRDCDIVVLAEPSNFDRLSAALDELLADCIAVPPKDWKYLDRGHAIHFRCKHPDALDIRLDVMTKMRGCDAFAELWDRRTTLEDADGTVFQLLGIEDLIRAKKTQRDKDWPMIQRLVDAHYEEFREAPNEDRVRFWLRESRTPEVLIRVGAENFEIIQQEAKQRPLLAEAMAASKTAIRQELEKEQAREKEADQAYWNPLKRELEQLRRERNRKTDP